MSAEPTPAEALRASAEKVEYVVQLLEPAIDEGARKEWTDIAVVAVPKRSQTRTILLQGLSDAGVSAKTAIAEGLRFRVLDAEAAHEHRLKVKEPREPEIELA